MLSPKFPLCPQDGIWNGPWEGDMQLWAGRADVAPARINVRVREGPMDQPRGDDPGAGQLAAALATELAGGLANSLVALKDNWMAGW